MANKWSWSLLGVVLLALTIQGCMVKASVYRNLRNEHEDTLASLQGMKSQLAATNSDLEKTEATKAALEKDLQETEERLLAAKQGPGVSPDLRKIWDRLEALASGHKDIMRWDPQTRKLLVSVEFDLGKAEVKTAGKSAIKDIAGVLKGLSSEYRVYVDGHTDNLPVRNPETLKKYKNNRELSLGRASAVCGVMQEHGVSPKLMIARGFGEYCPIVSNLNADGRQKNRRVEISVVPTASTFTPTAMAKPESEPAAE
ncbi:MAG TPA: OmpA family protein [Planctomycetota bacterium]|nr:OmpA family protein [Planctomycetota bacterium]